MEPSFEQVHRAIRECLRRGEKEQALVTVEAFLQKAPDSVPALIWYAGLTPDLEKGIQALERVLELDPQNPRARAGLQDLRARLASIRPTEEPPAQEDGELAASTGIPAPAAGAESLIGATVHGDEVIAFAESLIWPFRGLNRPIGQLLKEGNIRDKDLAWAGGNARDPRLRWAAGILLRRSELRGKEFPVDAARTAVWPFRGLNRPIGELVAAGTVRLEDLAYALLQGREASLRCAAAVVGYAIVRGSAQCMPAEEAKSERVPERPVEAAPGKPLAQGAMHVSAAGRARPQGEAAVEAPPPGRLEVVLGSGYLEKQQRSHREKRKRIIRWVLMLLAPLAFVTMLSGILLPTRKVPLHIAVALLFALWVIEGLLDRTIVPIVNRLRREEEAYARGRAAEDRLAALLSKHLDSAWTLFRNVVLPGRPDDIDAVLLGPRGLYALEVKAYSGLYRNVGERWEYRHGRFWREADENPTAQALGNAARLRDYLREIVGTEVWVEPRVVWGGNHRVVFEQSRVRIWELGRPDYWLRELCNGKPLPKETVERIRVALRAVCSTLR